MDKNKPVAIRFNIEESLNDRLLSHTKEFHGEKGRLMRRALVNELDRLDRVNAITAKALKDAGEG